MKLSDTSDVERFLFSHQPLQGSCSYSDGMKFGEWIVTAFLGRGGSGEVYRVVHESGETHAALKVSIAGKSNSKDRVSREADFLSSTRCRFFPRFYESGCRDDCSWFVMELLEPHELPSKDASVARFLLDVADAVKTLHTYGFVHRDLKPSNIMCRLGIDKHREPVLIDFGLLKVDPNSPVTQGMESFTVVDGRVVGSGTYRYAAPEQFANGKISPAVDIHALGVLANECFGGKPNRCWSKIIRCATSSIASMRYRDITDFIKAVRGRLRMLRLAQLFTALVCACLCFWGIKFRQAAIVWISGRNNSHSYGAALGAMEFKWDTSINDPWAARLGMAFDGGAAVESSGGGGGIAETYLKTTIDGIKKMIFKYQRSWYKGIFSVEIDGKVVFEDKTFNCIDRGCWHERSIDISKGKHEVSFKYAHPGFGYRDIFNGVRIDNVHFLRY